MDKVYKALQLELEAQQTKGTKKDKIFTKVKDIIPHKEDFNFMADLLFLPTTKQGYKYLLVIVDLYTDEFDMEPIKNKESKTILKASKKIFKREYLNLPYASIATDSGSEFKSDFSKFLEKNVIFHKISSPNRHSQMSNVESLNKEIGKILNLYMNKIESETGKEYKEWIKAVPLVRKELNKHRIERNKKEMKDYQHNYVIPLEIKPKFKVGDVVYYKLDKPRNGLNKEINSDKFRVGDFKFSRDARKIQNIFYYSSMPYHRYSLESINNKSFTDSQLKLANKKQSTYNVKKIIGKKKIKNKINYLVWWEGGLKKDATWEPRKSLIEDGLKDVIKQYDNKN